MSPFSFLETLKMKPEKDSYIIVKVGKKNKLGFAHNPERNSCYLEETLQDEEPVVFEYDEKTLIACLGTKPEVGSVFGVYVEPHRAEKEHPLGMVHYYRRMSKLDKKALRSAMDTTVTLLQKHGLDDILPIQRIEIRSAKGRYAGCYKYKLVDGKAQDAMILHPQTFEDLKYNIYVLAHELGHALWYRRLPDAYRARWLALYNSYTTVNNAKRTRLEQLLKALVDSQVSVREFKRDLEEDDAALFKEVETYLKRHHKLSPEGLNILLNHNSQTLGEIWPSYASLSETEQPISAYGATSVFEFAAESFAFYLTGKQLPKRIDKLMERSIKQMRVGR